MIFIITWSIWFLSEILLNRFIRSGNDDKKEQDNGSIRNIWIAISVSVSLGIISSILFKIPISGQLIVPHLGLFLIIAGMIFRFISIWSLGRFFTVDVTIRRNHQLIKDGLYRLIRHPSYAGSVMSFIGFGLSLNNWISLIIIIISITYAMLNRIKIEEKVLIDHFGSEYTEYIKNTYRLIPWIY